MRKDATQQYGTNFITSQGIIVFPSEEKVEELKRQYGISDVGVFRRIDESMGLGLTGAAVHILPRLKSWYDNLYNRLTTEEKPRFPDFPDFVNIALDKIDAMKSRRARRELSEK